MDDLERIMRAHFADGLASCKEMATILNADEGDAAAAFVVMLSEIVNQKMSYNGAVMLHYATFVKDNDKSPKAQVQAMAALKAIHDWKPLMDKMEKEGECKITATHDEVRAIIGNSPL